MKSGVMGAALLAAVSACALMGGAQRAEAATVLSSVTFSGSLTDGSPISGSGSAQVNQAEYPFDGSYGTIDFKSSPFTYQGTAAISIATEQDTPGRVLVTFVFYVGDSLYSTLNFPPAVIYYAVRFFPFPGGPLPSAKLFNFNFDAAELAQYGSGYVSTLNSDGITYTNDALDLTTFSAQNVVSAVPLPSSAPLLGAAILALGGIGYARRRVTQAS